MISQQTLFMPFSFWNYRFRKIYSFNAGLHVTAHGFVWKRDCHLATGESSIFGLEFPVHRARRAVLLQRWSGIRFRHCFSSDLLAGQRRQLQNFKRLSSACFEVYIQKTFCRYKRLFGTPSALLIVVYLVTNEGESFWTRFKSFVN